ncbi:MAG: FGGY-family carbohydrate kinase [Synechococcus sp.]|nr:FGGY-family carbohydrate kinase [Synechococcus sp.]
MSSLALGLDLGSSGLRLALLAAEARADQPLLIERSCPYPRPFEDPEGWRQGFRSLVAGLDPELRHRIGAIAIAGTSGTLLCCDADGGLLPAPLGMALPYHLSCEEQQPVCERLCGSAAGSAASASGSLARALRLLGRIPALAEAGPQGASHLLLRHQADWLMGWLLGDWRWGEEGNNLRLGWDLQRRCWSGSIARQPWAAALPRIRPSGTVLGCLAPGTARLLDLPDDCRVVAGSTDANAGVLAVDPGEGDGITVLGTTLVLKQFVTAPIEAPGVSSHRVAGRWLLGGASNAGAGILRRFFNDDQIRELSRQIDPQRCTGLDLLPLPRRGERFPVDDPRLEPRLGPRPISDALYLQALLEGLTALEQRGWQRFAELGAPPLRRVISLGGGARNPQWARLRRRALGVPVLLRPGLSAALGMARLAQRAAGGPEDPHAGGG